MIHFIKEPKPMNGQKFSLENTILNEQIHTMSNDLPFVIPKQPQRSQNDKG